MSKQLNKPDKREMPAYTIPEAAHFLNIPVSTIRYWCTGNSNNDGVIKPAIVEHRPVLLSFYNLVELHLLGVIRREHNIRLPMVRTAIEYLEKKLNINDHPLIRREMQTDGAHLFIEQLGELVNISLDGQQVMRSMLDAALKRIIRDDSGLPRKLFPFTRRKLLDSPTVVVIDPGLSGGRPVISGTGLATEIIAERFRAGESIEELARDYERKEEEIQEAIRCEQQIAA
jgi:uncharacterized protein (DUF433 family)